MRHRLRLAAPVAVLIASLAACGGGTDASGIEYKITGQDLAPRNERLLVTRDGQDVPDATVKVNGVNLVYANGAYTGLLPSALAAGATMNLSVEIGTTVITGRGTVPDPAEVQEPSGSVPVIASAPIIVEWVSLHDPQKFILRAECTTCTHTYFQSPLGSARSFPIPANTLMANETYQFTVTAYNNGTFTGPVDDGSSMNVANTGQTTTVTLQP